MPVSDELRREIGLAHQEARQVGDSPIRADRLAARVVAIGEKVGAAEISDEMRGRLRAALADAERVLRRDDDGQEAARHLQTAMRLAEERKTASPFELEF